MNIQPVNQNQQSYKRQNFSNPNFKALIKPSVVSNLKEVVGKCLREDSVAKGLRADDPIIIINLSDYMAKFAKALKEKTEILFGIRDFKGNHPIVDGQPWGNGLNLILKTESHKEGVPGYLPIMSNQEGSTKGIKPAEQLAQEIIEEIKTRAVELNKTPEALELGVKEAEKNEQAATDALLTEVGVKAETPKIAEASTANDGTEYLGC